MEKRKEEHGTTRWKIVFVVVVSNRVLNYVCVWCCVLLACSRWWMATESNFKKIYTKKIIKWLRRHERPVIGDAVSIVHLDDDLVVVHKPPSVPVSSVVSIPLQLLFVPLFHLLLLLLLLLLPNIPQWKTNCKLIVKYQQETTGEHIFHFPPCVPSLFAFLWFLATCNPA